jgi:hypothetical protein
MNRSISLALVGLLAISPFAAHAQVVPTSKGSVEFLGLEKWTPAEIQKRLGYTSPDQLHYCAADLKKLGFPEASVFGYSEQGRRFTVVTVVEPQRADEVIYKTRPSAHISLSPQWQKLASITKDSAFLEGGILDYSRNLAGALADRPWLSDGTPQKWWPLVQSFDKESDFRQAQRVLGQADDPNARAAAAVVLINFSSKDAAWRNLISGLRDPDNLVQSVCSQALNSLATYHPRKVNWATSIPDLTDLLHGTDLFAFQFVLKTLSATEVSPALAGPLLSHGGARLVIAYLRAHHEDQHDIAHQFLVGIAGRDFGTDPGPWENWIAHLS